MRQAIALAREGMTGGKGGPFGAIIVRAGEIVSTGQNEVTSTPDPTAHAEIVAIRRAALALGRFDLTGCDIYTTCEPCPMCLAAIYWARLDTIYYACTRTDAAAVGFDDALIYEQIGLDISARSVPMHQVGHCDAACLFDEWQAKPDRIPY
jgi:guanine deaminase